MKHWIIAAVDFFYPLFRKWMPLQTYRYAACGGGNTLLGLFLFFIAYNFILDKQVLHLSFMAISPHIAAYLLSFLVTFPLGFYLSRYVVFPGSGLRGRVQLFRYLVVVVSCIIINYSLLKLFVDYLGWYPTPSQLLATVIIILFSYLSQRHYTFQVK